MSLVLFISFSIYLIIRFYVLASFKDKMIKQVPKSAVETAYSIIDSTAKKFKDLGLSETEAQNEVRESIKNLRLEDGTYFWIHDLNLKMILHPIKPELNGTDLSRFKSPSGHFIFQEMNKALSTEAKNSTWYNYYWPKPNETTEKEKTSYLKVYGPWGWVVGAGMYIEDVESSMRNFFLTIEVVIILLFSISLLLAHFIATRISEQLKKVSFEVDKTTAEFKNAATQTKKAIQSLSQTSVEQSSAIEETAASVYEIQSMADLSNKNSENTLNISYQNKEISLKGKSALCELENAIHEIDKFIKSMNREIEHNNQQFESIILVINEIGSKTKIIDDIVFQTKLLSFNASVEAARAGVNGKGFAVVAEEVGKLAAISGGASKEINELIFKSTKHISTIVEESKNLLLNLNHEITLKIEDGQSASKEFSQVFDVIIENIEKMNSSINEMSLASREQSEGIKQINIAIAQLSESGHESMSSTESIKFQIENLHTGTENLDKSVKTLNREIVGEFF